MGFKFEDRLKLNFYELLILSTIKHLSSNKYSMVRAVDMTENLLEIQPSPTTIKQISGIKYYMFDPNATNLILQHQL